jgi:putative hydrolase of the HAD superfamily
MKVIKAVFFDAGNTLVLLDCDYVCAAIGAEGFSVDPNTIQAAEYHVRFAIDEGLVAFQSAGQDLQPGIVSMKTSQPLRQYFSALLESLDIPKAVQPRIVQNLISREKADARGMWHKVEPTLDLTLTQLRQKGYTLGVISNSDGRLRDKFYDLGLTRHFSIILDSEEVGIEKPDPRLFQMALQECGLKPSESLYIGDIYSIDVIGARRAGMNAILYDPGGVYRSLAPSSIRSWNDLIPRLEEEDQHAFLNGEDYDAYGLSRPSTSAIV